MAYERGAGSSSSPEREGRRKGFVDDELMVEVIDKEKKV
jgi:hypothetical protein